MDDFRSCPYCGEQIRSAAIRCRYCRSRVAALDPERWYRDQPDRRVAGVASAVARALAVPVGAVRLAFIVLTFVHLIGPLLYGALWLLIPYAPGGDAPFGSLVALGRNAFEALRDAFDRLTAPRAPRGDDPPRRTNGARESDGGGGSRVTSLPVQHLSS